MKTIIKRIGQLFSKKEQQEVQLPPTKEEKDATLKKSFQVFYQEIVGLETNFAHLEIPEYDESCEYPLLIPKGLASHMILRSNKIGRYCNDENEILCLLMYYRYLLISEVNTEGVNILIKSERNTENDYVVIVKHFLNTNGEFKGCLYYDETMKRMAELNFHGLTLLEGLVLILKSYFEKNYSIFEATGKSLRGNEIFFFGSRTRKYFPYMKIDKHENQNTKKKMPWLIVDFYPINTHERNILGNPLNFSAGLESKHFHFFYVK